MSVVVVGLNHRTVGLELLERMAVPRERLGKALHDLAGRDHLSEVVVLSTCYRTEVYAVAERFHGAVQDVRTFLSELAFAPPEEFTDHLYTYYDEAAAAHLFAVAAGIDSMVLGESEILGQVRGAWEVARVEDAAGSRLSALFRHAVQAGKRARASTDIGRHTASVSHAVVDMATARLGTLAGAGVLVVGAGDIGESMAVALSRAGGAHVSVANRTAGRAGEVAARIGGRAVAFSDVAAELAGVDLLLTSTGSPDVVLSADDVAAVMARRPDRPLLVVDVALPRDVDPAVALLPGVTLLDLTDLKAFADAGLGERRREVARVRAIIADEVERYVEAVTARTMAPTVSALRRRAEAIRRGELERFAGRLDGLDERQRQAVEALTRGVVAKLLHEPTVSLKGAAGSPRGERLADALRELFDI